MSKIPNPEEKPCSKCGTVKPLSEYYCYGGRVLAACKECIIRHASEQNKIHQYHRRTQAKPEYRIYQRKYFLANRKKFSGYAKAWRARNPDYHREYYHRKKAEKAK